MSRSSTPSLDLVVVIPSFNQRELLAACLDSLVAEFQRSGLAGQIVVVDNASWDGSADMVASRFPQVTLLENDVNVGFAAACNQGGRVYQSRYVLLMNNDATLEAGSMRAMITYADEAPQMGALTGRLLSIEGHERYPAAHFFQRWLPPPRRVHELSWVPGTALLLRRGALDAVGWLDEDFFFYNEDLDLSRRLKKAGWKLIYLPEMVVHHRESGSSELIRPRAMLEGYKGTLLLALKHHGAWTYRALRFGMRVEVIVRLFFLAIGCWLWPDVAPWRVRREAYQAIRALLRQGVQASTPAASAPPGDASDRLDDRKGA